YPTQRSRSTSKGPGATGTQAPRRRAYAILTGIPGRNHPRPRGVPPMTGSSDALVAAAGAARRKAHAPFSRFLVGAALEFTDGQVVTGCNCESASYGLTMCAERVAIFKALSEGLKGCVRVAIVADTASPTPPCGACRQWLWEFA